MADLDAIDESLVHACEMLGRGADIQWMCSHCGPHPESRGNWCAVGCGSDYNRMERTVVFSPSLMQHLVALEVIADAAKALIVCDRCNGGGLIAPGDCCQTCGGDGMGFDPDHPLHDKAWAVREALHSLPEVAPR